MTRAIALRPGLLDRLRRMSGLVSDEAFARAIGVTIEELRAVAAGTAPSMRFIAGLGDAFGLSLGEIATFVAPEDTAA